MIPLVDFKQLSAGEKDSEILRRVDWIGTPSQMITNWDAIYGELGKL